MNKIFLDVTNSVVPQTTAEALVSSEIPPPVTTLTLFPVTAAAQLSTRSSSLVKHATLRGSRPSKTQTPTSSLCAETSELL